MKEFKINTFRDICELILNPEAPWIRRKKVLILEYKDLYYEIFYKEAIDILTLWDNGTPFNLKEEEHIILARALSFVIGGETHEMKESGIDWKTIKLTDYYPKGGRKFVKQITLIKGEYIKDNSTTRVLTKRKKITIIEKHSKTRLDKNDFIDSCINTGSIGTIGEALGVIKIKEDSNPYEDHEIASSGSMRKEKTKQIRKEKEFTKSLVLWDIENVHFRNDFQEITRLIKKSNQLRFVAFHKKHKSSEIKIKMNMDFKISKLKKRDWIITGTSDIADEELIKNYYKYRDSLTELVVITGDIDFKGIIDDAISLDIKVRILNNANFSHDIWYKEYKEYKKIH